MKSVTKKILVGDLLEDPIFGYLSVVLRTEYLLALPFRHDFVSSQGEMLYPLILVFLFPNRLKNLDLR